MTLTDDPGYDLVLLLGQSNMVGWAGTGQGWDTTYFDVTDPRVLQYGAYGPYGQVLSARSGVIGQAVEPLTHPDPGGLGTGVAVHFARWLLDVRPGRRILLVPCAHGGSSLSTNDSPLGWRYGISRNLTDLAIDQTRRALAAAGPGSRVVAAVWAQGEDDGLNSTAAATYATDLDALIAGLRDDLDEPELPFLICGLNPEGQYLGTRTDIAAVQAATPSRVPHTGYAPGPIGLTGDALHYTAPGYRVQARTLLDAYLMAVRDDEVAPGEPRNLRVTAANSSSVILVWDEVAGAESYLVEKRSGGAWSSAGTPMLQTLNPTGLSASTVYDFRVSAVNAAGQSVSEIISYETPGANDAADNFNRPNSGTLGNTPTNSVAWTTGAGTWAISGNRLYASGLNTSTGAQCVVTTSTTDGTLEATLDVTFGGLHGLIFRAGSTENSTGYVLFREPDGSYRLTKRAASGGGFTSIGLTSVGIGADGDVLTVVLSGSSIIVKVNGSTELSLTDSSYTGSYHGLWAYGSGTNDVRFDNFSWTV